METVGWSTASAADQLPRLAPPDLECCEETLATSESFFVDQSGKAPVDEQTGMPLPIAPHVNLAALRPN